MLMVDGGLPRMLLIFLHTEEAFVLIGRASTYDCHSFFSLNFFVTFARALFHLILYSIFSVVLKILKHFSLDFHTQCTLCSTMVWAQIVSSGTRACACSSAHLKCCIILQHIAQDHSPRLQVLIARSSLK